MIASGPRPKDVPPIINDMPPDSFPPYKPASPLEVSSSIIINEGHDINDSQRSGIDLVRRFDLLSTEIVECRERLAGAEDELRRVAKEREQDVETAQEQYERVREESAVLPVGHRTRDGPVTGENAEPCAEFVSTPFAEFTFRRHP
jgi:hypothetical protein